MPMPEFPVLCECPSCKEMCDIDPSANEVRAEEPEEPDVAGRTEQTGDAGPGSMRMTRVVFGIALLILGVGIAIYASSFLSGGQSVKWTAGGKVVYISDEESLQMTRDLYSGGYQYPELAEEIQLLEKRIAEKNTKRFSTLAIGIAIGLVGLILLLLTGRKVSLCQSQEPRVT